MAILLALQQFIGANSQLNEKQLPAGVGVNARNLDVSHGDFRGLKAAELVHTLTGYIAQQISLYRFDRDTPPADDGSDIWIASSLDADYMRSLIALDTTERTYWTDGVKPRYTDNTLIGTAPYPTGSVTLGVPAPDSSMSATLLVAGTGPDETRVYTDTFMRANGDESAPNAITTSITVKGGSTVTLNSFDAVPSGSHGITKRRIYVSTGGDFRRVAEITSATSSTVDSGTRGAILQTGGSTTKPAWLEPPDELVGLTALWGSMAGGFVGKSYRTCVPGFVHAWPIEYEGVVPDTIVGSAVFGTNWVLTTTGTPYVVNGSTPASMRHQQIYFEQACVSKRSTVSVKHGVCWASREGLCYYGTNGPPRILTQGFISLEEWDSLNPETITGAHWKGWYIGFYNNASGRKGFMVNTVNPQGVIWLDQGAYGAYADSLSGDLYLLSGSFQILKWYSGDPLTATFKTGKTRSKVEANPGVGMVVGTIYTSASLKLYADGTLKHTKTLTDREPFRLPGGYKARDWQVELIGTGPIEGVIVADEMVDLP